MTTASEVISQAERWLGTVEDPAGSNKVVGITDWYGLTGPWCAMFVSRVFHDAGLPLPASTSKGFAYTPSGANWFRKNNAWKNSNPQPGDVVFFDFPGDGVDRISHVGIVTGVNSDGSISTIEGNTDERGGRTGGKVMRRIRRVGIVGYGVPAYAAASSPAPPPQPPADEFKEKIMALPTMKRGSKDSPSENHVKNLQALLCVAAGDLVRSYAGSFEKFVDGDFGPTTERVLREWQGRTRALDPDGIAGPRTNAWLHGV